MRTNGWNEQMNIKNHIGIGLTTFILAATAHGDMTGEAYEIGYAWSGSTFGGTTSGYVVDLYLEFDSLDDILLNVYNFNDVNMGTTYYQGLTSAGWAPNLQGGPFDTQDAREFDSFIAIGDTGPLDSTPVQMSDNAVAVDPNFNNNNAPGPMENAGWYNGNPNNPLGQAQDHDLSFNLNVDPGFVVFIGRFSIEGSDGFSMIGSTGFATFNQGIGTDPGQAGFTVVPAPGALALLGLAGLSGGRRRK